MATFTESDIDDWITQPDSDVKAYVKQEALRFFNNVVIPHSIDGHEPGAGPIYDDPNISFENNDPTRDDYDIGMIVAERIIQRRADLGGSFSNLTEMSGIQGLGEDKMRDILFSFSPERGGMWEYKTTSPVGVVHAALLNTGKVLLFAGELEGMDLPHESSEWDYINDSHDVINGADAYSDDIFCSHHTFLQDGRLLVNGGAINQVANGIVATYLYDPEAADSDKWNKVADMKCPRWYPTSLTLPDGKVLTMSGYDDRARIEERLEVYDPNDGPNGSWTLLPNSACRKLEIYPGLHLLPDGRIFHSGTRWAGHNSDKIWGGHPKPATFDPDTNKWKNVDHHECPDRTEGMSVILPPDNKRVMVVGGYQKFLDDNYGLYQVEVIDFNDDKPKWEIQSYTRYFRRNVNVVLLPDGNVLACTGVQHFKDDDDQVPIRAAELFNNERRSWSTMNKMYEIRYYHSVSLLLPDATVMVSGSSTNGTGGINRTIEVFRPPYLFKGDRPVINTDSAPDEIVSEFPFEITLDNAISVSAVSLVKPMATTHHTDTEQRVIPLNFTEASGNRLLITAPSTTAPNIMGVKGYYMLFVMSGEGVPSVAHFVKLT